MHCTLVFNITTCKMHAWLTANVHGHAEFVWLALNILHLIVGRKWISTLLTLCLNASMQVRFISLGNGSVFW